jgi:lipid-A-disaccharide synthase
LKAGKTVFISSGEVSGDHYIAGVVRLLREKGFCGRIYGMCGAESRKEDVEELWRGESLHLMGISEVFRSLGSVLRLMKETERDILATDPDAMIVADSPDFHLPLLRGLRRRGYRGRVFYISPPSVWAWRKGRAETLRRCADVLFPLFAFEHDYLRKAGCESRWTGHPMAEEFALFSADRDSILADVKGPPCKGPVAALLPGSRRSEIKPLYPVLSGLYKLLEAKGFSPVFSVAPGLKESARSYLTGALSSSGERYYEGPGRNIMSLSDVVAGSSGTATAEALFLRRFMVVLYKLRPLSYLVGLMLLRGVRFAVPNILAGEYFYPELLQGKATAENAFRAVMEWTGMTPSKRASAALKMEELVGMMGSPGACGRWADEILEVLR